VLYPSASFQRRKVEKDYRKVGTGGKCQDFIFSIFHREKVNQTDSAAL
jgi:hypothetical protein